jgi:hypothetical protein
MQLGSIDHAPKPILLDALRLDLSMYLLTDYNSSSPAMLFSQSDRLSRDPPARGKGQSDDGTC